MNDFSGTVANRIRLLLLTGAMLPAFAAADALPWTDSLVNDGGGYWRRRAIVELSRGSQSVSPLRGLNARLTVGTQKGQIDLIGQRAEAIRVCDPIGREILFDLTDEDGRPKRTGAVSAGDVLAFRTDLAPDEEGDERPNQATCHVIYYDNPDAAAPADYLSAGLVNGGFEFGDDVPIGWYRQAEDTSHRVAWVTEQPRSGRRCGRATVDPGAEATGVQWVQTGLVISPGVRYQLTGWVRAKDVKGSAGWYIHVHGDKPMVINQVASAGDGTYDWREVTIDLTTPDDAKLAAVGTMLHGTGTAWFDDVSLSPLDEVASPRIASVVVERRDLEEIPGRSGWLLPAEEWPYRVKLVVGNTGDEALMRSVASINLNREIHQIGCSGGAIRIAVVDPASPKAVTLPTFGLMRNRLFVATLPAKTRKTFHAYLGVGAKTGPDDATSYPQLLASSANLVQNADFEKGDKLPEAWDPGSGQPEKGKPQCTFSRVKGGRFGQYCGRLDIPRGATLRWSGWKQGLIPVQPNTTYLYAGWLKCQDVDDGTVTLHGHCHRADGNLATGAKFFSTSGSLSGTKDWTLLQAEVKTPSDCTHVMLHLTMNAHGTVWHDGILFCREATASTGRLETVRPPRAPDARRLHVWQVNPIVKVFRETPPGKQATALTAQAAANEYEPVQIVLRSRSALQNVRVSATPLRGKRTTLPPVQIDRVGYVPVDVPSSYYVSTLPKWYRLVPRGTVRTDGWGGDWPDPLPPCTPFDLPADQSQPIWLTVHVPPGTSSGEYHGKVTIQADSGLTEHIPMAVTVWPFELPATPSLRVIYDLRRGPGANPFGDGSIDAMRKWYTLLGEHRISPGLLPSPEFTYKDGKASMDTGAFDAAARICLDELKMNVFYSPHLFYAFGWAYKPRALFGHEAFSDEYTRAFKACYRAFLDHLKKNGWYDKLVNYVSDEPHYSHEHVVEQMKQICDLAHSVDPNVPLYSSTWQHVPAWNGYLDIWGVGQHGCFPVEEMKRRLTDGDRIWLTTDGQQALDTPYLGTERLLPYYCFKYGAEAYEFWGVSWWTYDPWERGYHWFISQSDDGKRSYRVRYPNGDGYLTYPGERVGLDRPVSSIRLEQAREGIEDYEYLSILRELIRRRRGNVPADALAAAQSALDGAGDLVSIPNAGGRFSTEILPDPDAVPKIRRAVAQQIVRLKSNLGT